MALFPEAVGLFESRDRAGAGHIGRVREHPLLPREAEDSARVAWRSCGRVCVKDWSADQHPNDVTSSANVDGVVRTPDVQLLTRRRAIHARTTRDRRAVRRAHPNPARVGCPPQPVSIALARRERPLGGPGHEHLTACSPCHLEGRAVQEADPQQCRQRPVRTFLLCTGDGLRPLTCGLHEKANAPRPTGHSGVVCVSDFASNTRRTYRGRNRDTTMTVQMRLARSHERGVVQAAPWLCTRLHAPDRPIPWGYVITSAVMGGAWPSAPARLFAARCCAPRD